MNKNAWASALTLGLLGAGSAAQAELLDAGNGLVDDTVLNICWVADASLSGEQTWDDLVNWAADLEYGGYDDWRLAQISSTSPTNSPYDCSGGIAQACSDSGNELGYMFHHSIPGDFPKNGNQTVGAVTLTNIQTRYWSGTADESNLNNAWLFRTGDGLQGVGNKDSELYGWAVRPGQCRAAPPPPPPPPAQPIPAISVWGLGVLSLLLMVLARARLR